jgi:hypothetical protein
MDLPVVEKPIPAISMNYDNRTVIVKVNSSKDKVHKACEKAVEVCQKIEKLRSNSIGLCQYVQKSSRSIYQGSITQCDRRCIEGVGLKTQLKSHHSGNLFFVIGDPVK